MHFDMFASKCILILAISYILSVRIYSILAASDGNINIMKDEIAKALEGCGESIDYRQSAQDEYKKIASSLHHMENKTQIRTKRSKSSLRNDFLIKAIDDSDSEDWDYGEYNRNQGRSWNDPKDNKSIIDSVYSHDRRNSSNGSNSNNSNKHNQNNTRETESKNNFNSRGGSIYSGFLKPDDDKKIKSVRDLNFSANLYDPYMTRGLRSVSDRFKRFDRLINNVNDNEVDDRGIPKEGLFLKLIESTIISQQSKVIIEGQIRACFKEIATGSEENGCSYSNTLERCMDFQLKKRKSLINEDATLNADKSETA